MDKFSKGRPGGARSGGGGMSSKSKFDERKQCFGKLYDRTFAKSHQSKPNHMEKYNRIKV